MKILAVADEESAALWDYYEPEKVRGVDLILSAGDVKAEYLEFLVTMTNLPLLYIRGNHDDCYKHRAPEGCICIEDKLYNYKGLRIMGLGGSMYYHPGENMYTEQEMKRRILRADMHSLFKGGCDILLTHSPARGYGDMDDLPHRGFECFNNYLEKWHPKYMIHGHVHKAYGHFQQEREHTCGTKIVNACGYTILDIPESDYPQYGQTGSPLYDLYITLQGMR